MATLSLKIALEGGAVTKTIQFDPQISVFDACKIIREKFAEAVHGKPSEYGLFASDEDSKQGVWLESGRNLGYYFLRNHDVLEYRRKLRTLRVRMLDGAVKTILVDDSQSVSQLMVVICTKIGITNHEEYGLVREENDQQNENLPDNKTGTLTLRRKFAEKDRDAKMESLRKKLKTDDEIVWVDTGKTLREQGIDESETVLLKRKFFFSDQNIDSRDPVQLNLLYVQARDAILDGTHPVTQEKACEFAGIQAQIQFGDYIESKHKSGFLDLKEFLPQSYARVKSIEKKVFAEHRKHIGLSEPDAKVLYTKTARELPTYGVTFFLVKEKMTGKNKLTPRLLGVTKNSVLRLDERTKEILKTWPLTTVRRWGASPNTFTLDFGDYADQYYSVQTTEAEQIVQLIAGYIDIIMKKKQNKDHFGLEGDEGSTMVEESVAPSKATFLQCESNNVSKVTTESLAKPVIIRASDGERPYIHQEIQTVQYGAVIGQVNMAHQPPTLKEAKINSVYSEPQRALHGYISAGKETIRIAEEELLTKAPLPDQHSLEWRENTLDTTKHAVSVHIANVNAATAQVVTATQPDDVDHEVISHAVTQITESIPEVTKEVRLLAALMEDDNNGNKLLDTARKLCNALSDLLKAAEPESKEPRQNLLNAASRVGEASGKVLTTIGEETLENREMHDMLLQLAKAVANTTAALVLRAKAIATDCEDDILSRQVIEAASQCALATSQLVACTRVVAPTIQNDSCRDSLEAAAKEVSRTVTNLLDACKFATDDQNLKSDLMGAAKKVSESLADLLHYLKQSGDESPVEKILITTDKLVSSVDPQEMVRQARVLGQVTAELIKSIKSEAEQEREPGEQHRLLAAAKKLADATAKMVEAARLCASSPHDSAHQTELRSAAEELRDITTSKAHTPAIRRRVIQRLQTCAKDAASSVKQCISASHSAIEHSDDQQTKEQLMQDCRVATDYIPALVSGIKISVDSPNDSKSQMNLIEISEQFVDAGSHMASSARAFYPTVRSHTASQHLSECALTLTHSINELNSATQRAREACSGQELESAIDCVRNLRNVLNDTRTAYLNRELRPLPNETSENTSQQLTKSAKAVSLALSQLLSAISQDERIYAGVAGRDLALSLGDFTKNVRGVVATGGNADLIDSADQTIINTMRVMDEAQQALDNGDGGSNLQQSARDVTNALQVCIECLPGQREVDEALRTVNECSEIINMGDLPTTQKSYGELQNELRTAANNLNEASGEVAKAYSSPAWLAVVSQNYSVVYKDLLMCTLEMVGQTVDETAQTNIMNGLRGVSATSVSLLSTAKSVASDPNQINAKGQLSSASRTVTDSINYLVDVSTQAAPCQKECDNAIRSIETLRPLLDNPVEPINDQGYYECVDLATEKSRQLGIAISDTVNKAKNYHEFGHSVNQISDAIRGLIESAAQVSYLVGVSHPTSTSGRPGIIDQTQLYRAYQGIRQNCDIVSNSNTTKQQKITALTAVAKQTSFLCTVCRRASLNTSNPVAKNEFIEGAKSVANTTADLVAQVKSLEDEYSAPSREKYVEPLLEAVNSLCQYASQQEFISIPPNISEEGRNAQNPILQSGRNVLNSVVEMVKVVKSLAVAPKDPTIWQKMSNYSTPVSAGVKSLIDAIRERHPGEAQCDSVLETIERCTRELNTASMSIGVQGLPKRQDNNLQGFTNQMLNASAELLDRLDPIKSAAKQNPESLGHAVTELSRYIVPLTQSAIGTSSHIIRSDWQISLLDKTKSVVEMARELVESAKEAAGNPRAAPVHMPLDDVVDKTRVIIHELNTAVETISTESGIVSGLMEQIYRSMARFTDKRQSNIFNPTSNKSFVEHQTSMVQTAKEIARLANEMNAKAAIDPSKLAQPSVDITHHYNKLAFDAIGASNVTTSSDSALRIKQSVQELGRAIGTLIQSSIGARVDDAYTLNEISSAARSVSEKVSQVLAALQAGSKGTQACINAANTVSGIIGDLDTTIMFATAGTLHSDNDGNFADHREHILKTAKALVEDTKVLVAGAAGSQEQLSTAAHNAVTTIIQLADAVKRGAHSLGSSQSESQVMVINAVKDVASALGELINTTKNASGKPVNDPYMQELKESAKVMVLNVSSLLKTVKAVEDIHTRGAQAMAGTITAIDQEIRVIRSPMLSGGAPNTPEDLIRVTRNVTLATAKAVAAGASNLTDDIVAAANLGRRSISEMLTVCRSVAWNCAETPELRQRTLDAGVSVATSYKLLLEGVLKGCSADDRMHLSRQVAKNVTDLVAMAQLLKGSDWVDPEDPTVIAENELLGAAASIDAAAKKLANLRPRRQLEGVKEADLNLQFDEMILEAARSIMTASSALVRAANAAQRELIDQGKVARSPHISSDDGQWSEGLISAARLVAAATHTLVEAAQNLVQGLGTEEILISSAKQVAASTAQLLIACKVRSDPNSETGRRLQAAGNAVIKSTDNLVRAAQQALDMEEEHILKINTSMVDGMAQEINARSEVIKMEKQLEEARHKLTAIRQAKYRHRNAVGLDDSDHDDQYMPPPPPPLPSNYQVYNNNRFNDSVHNSTSNSMYSSFQANRQQHQQQQQQQPPVPPPPSTIAIGAPELPSRFNRTILTGNATPRPYQPDTSYSSPVSPLLTTTFRPNDHIDKNRQLEACVQDLHEKTFGKGGVVPLSTFKQAPPHPTTEQLHQQSHPANDQSKTEQTYEGFTSRYETKCFQRNLSPNVQMELPTESLSQLSLNSGLTKSVSTSVASSTSIKRIQTGSQKVTTSFNSIERNN